MPNANLQIVYDFLVKGQGDLRAAQQAVAGITSESRRAGVAIDGMKRSRAAFAAVGSRNLVGITGLNQQKTISDLRVEMAARERLNTVIQRNAANFTNLGRAQAAAAATAARSRIGLSTIGLGGTGFGRGVLGGFLGFAALGGANQLGAGLRDLIAESIGASARAEQLGLSLDVLAERFGVSRQAMSATEDTLRSLNLTQVQSLDAIQLFTRAGAIQAEVVTLVGVAQDAAARRGLTLEDSLRRLSDAVAKAEPELLDELGIVLKLGEVYKDFAKQIGVANANQLTAAQRSRAVAAALADEAKSGGEFNASADSTSRLLKVDIPQASARAKESLGELFTGPAKDGAETYLAILNSINGLLETDFAKGVKAATRGGDPSSINPVALLARGVKATIFGAPNIKKPTFVGPPEDEFRRQEADAKAKREADAELFQKRAEAAEPRVLGLERQLAARQAGFNENIFSISDERRRQALLASGVKPDQRTRINLAEDEQLKLDITEKRADIEKEILDLQREQASLFADAKVSTDLLPEQQKQFDLITEHTRIAIDVINDRRRRGQESAVRGIEQETQFRERVLALSADEIGQGQALYKLRVDAAQRVFAITKDEFQLHEDLTAARLDGELLIAEIRRRQLDDYKESAGRVFDALIARGGGFQEFLKGQALTVGRTVFQNVAGELFNSTRGRAQLPGQTTTDAQGNPKLTVLGRILQNTPLGADPGKFALESNTTALQRLTTSVDALRTGALSASGGGGALGALSGQFPLGRDIEKSIDLFGKLPGLDKLGKSADASNAAANATKDVSKGLSKFLEFGVPLGIGGFGIASGIRQGGAGGKLSIAGGALTAASAIPGPQQPFLAAGGQALSLIGSLLGDPTQDRQEEIRADLDRRRFQSPQQRDFTQFSGGFETDLNFYRGAPRVINIHPVANVTINAIDSKSFSDHRQEIAGAVNEAIIEGADLNHTIQERFLPA